METKNRIVKALIIGAVFGVVYEFVVDPLINKPIEDKIEEIL